MRLLLLLALLINGATVYSQNIFKAQILDSLTKQPVEFVNVGLIGKGIGTVSNENGEFEFVIPDSLLQEKIRVSIIGYANKTFSANELKSRNKIFLRQSATNLSEVTIAAKKTKFQMLGHVTQTKAVSAGFSQNNLGAEMAVKLKIKHPQTQIRRFICNINKNTLNKLPIFRINIYKEDENGYPGEILLKQNIIAQPKEMTGLIEIDLSSYNIFVDQNVFISMEWIKDLGDAKGLYFSAKLLGGATYYRIASQDKWRKESPVGIGLYAEVAY
ncbi:MAG: carboxypeptidase-like regulatory domain-containing protein [Bacteroidia bacterium]|nr:carboxypeptidase-like regulatory domain-containing protein [Bacteroidia bacterium]